MSDKQTGNMRKNFFEVVIMLVFLAAATGVGYAFLYLGFPETNNVIVYLLAVLLTSWKTDGYLYGILASIIATFSYNFFFTPPFFTLQVHDPSYLITFAVMTIISIITSTLTSHVKRSSQEAREKEAETIKARELAEQERYRGNLLRAISHDLRTPLSGIIGTSEMLMAMTGHDETLYSLSKDIYTSADWLHAMVENILSLTRLQDGKLMPEKQPEAVEEVVEGAVNYVLQHAPGYDITVRTPDELLMVPMDAKLIKQVLINLLDNACKHTAPDGEITVSVRADGRYAYFNVADTGTGIDESDLPHLFQMFYTARAKPAEAKRGIGLGLTICDAIVKAHGGSISARNRAGGPGAEFEFTLPMEESNGKVQ